MLSSLIKNKLIERLAKLPIEGRLIKEVETDFLIKMNNNVIGYGYNYIADSDPAKLYGVPEWFKLSKSISAKISLLSREYPDAFCFFKQPSRIIYLPNINVDLIKFEYIDNIEDFVSKIHSRNNAISKKIEFERIEFEKQEILDNQTHFNEDQLESIRTILNKVDELKDKNFHVGLDLFIYSRINFTLLLTPSFNNPLGDGCRYYFNRKKYSWGNEFDKIPFTSTEELTSKFIAEYTTHKNSRIKKQVSREEFEKFMAESINYEDLKDLTHHRDY